MKNWPDKLQRERYEIEGFISAYQKLPHGREFRIKGFGDKPDCFVEDIKTGETFGIELTSVYLNDRSVPDKHKKAHEGPADIPYNSSEIDNYMKRLLDAIKIKNDKAKSYLSDYPMILSLYINEYCAIHMHEEDDWERFARANESFFDSILSFKEIVFWNLPNEVVFSIRSGTI